MFLYIFNILSHLDWPDKLSYLYKSKLMFKLLKVLYLVLLFAIAPHECLFAYFQIETLMANFYHLKPGNLALGL